MANDSLNISLPFKFDVKTAPYGLTDYDPKALSVDQQRELNVLKSKTRKENFVYLKKHPEVKAVLALISRTVMIHRPRHILNYVAELFSRPERIIRKEIYAIMNESPIEYEEIPYTKYEEWDY